MKFIALWAWIKCALCILLSHSAYNWCIGDVRGGTQEKAQPCSSNWKLDLYKPLLWFGLLGARRRCTQTTFPRRALSSCSTTRPGARCCGRCTASSTAPRGTCWRRSSLSTTPAREVRTESVLSLLLFIFQKMTWCGLLSKHSSRGRGRQEEQCRFGNTEGSFCMESWCGFICLVTFLLAAWTLCLLEGLFYYSFSVLHLAF